MNPIYLRNQPPPDETFDHKSFLIFLSSWIKPNNYLELGVRDGKVFTEISKYCQNSTAVDVVPREFELPNNARYHQTTTDSFFEHISPDVKFDMIFIDADHSHLQSLKDFINAQRHIIEDGFIILHDTYPLDKSWTIPKFCDDVYKTALYIKNHMQDDFEILTLPFHPGLTLIKKMKRNKQLLWL